jgi:hypothetical protein
MKYDDNKQYVVDGQALNYIFETSTELNVMSGQRLKGMGDRVRDIAQGIQLQVEHAVEVDLKTIKLADSIEKVLHDYIDNEYKQ